MAHYKLISLSLAIVLTINVSEQRKLKRPSGASDDGTLEFGKRDVQPDKRFIPSPLFHMKRTLPGVMDARIKFCREIFAHNRENMRKALLKETNAYRTGMALPPLVRTKKLDDLAGLLTKRMMDANSVEPNSGKPGMENIFLIISGALIDDFDPKDVAEIWFDGKKAKVTDDYVELSSKTENSEARQVGYGFAMDNLCTKAIVVARFEKGPEDPNDIMDMVPQGQFKRAELPVADETPSVVEDIKREENAPVLKKD